MKSPSESRLYTKAHPYIMQFSCCFNRRFCIVWELNIIEQVSLKYWLLSTNLHIITSQWAAVFRNQLFVCYANTCFKETIVTLKLVCTGVWLEVRIWHRRACNLYLTSWKTIWLPKMLQQILPISCVFLWLPNWREKWVNCYRGLLVMLKLHSLLKYKVNCLNFWHFLFCCGCYIFFILQSCERAKL